MGDDSNLLELERKCKELRRHHGHANYETWVTSLWIDNEYETNKAAHRMGADAAKNAKDDEMVKKGIFTECEAAKIKLAGHLKDIIEDGNPIIEDSGLYNDILGANLQEIDWYELAEHYLPEGTCGIEKK